MDRRQVQQGLANLDRPVVVVMEMEVATTMATAVVVTGMETEVVEMVMMEVMVGEETGRRLSPVVVEALSQVRLRILGEFIDHIEYLKKRNSLTSDLGVIITTLDLSLGSSLAFSASLLSPSEASSSTANTNADAPGPTPTLT
jgi:hypothetical protein